MNNAYKRSDRIFEGQLQLGLETRGKVIRCSVDVGESAGFCGGESGVSTRLNGRISVVVKVSDFLWSVENGAG